MSATNPVTEVLKAINKTKDDVLRGDDPPQYIPFVINRLLSYAPDMVMLANIMNRYSDLPHKAQFDFFRFSCPSRSRYHPTHKPEADDDLEVVKKTFGYNSAKARMALRCLTKGQIEAMKERLAGGGLS